jgi:hypothetical protein
MDILLSYYYYFFGGNLDNYRIREIMLSDDCCICSISMCITYILNVIQKNRE